MKFLNPFRSSSLDDTVVLEASEIKLTPEQIGRADLNYINNLGYYDLCQINENSKELKLRNKDVENSLQITSPLERGNLVEETVEASLTTQSIYPTETSEWNTLSSRYDILEQIGEGGTAIVYRALDKSLRREIALKRFHPDKGPDSDSNDYANEIEVISRIQHPNVVITHDMGFDTQGHFIIMNLLTGHDMQYWLDNDGLTLSEFKKISHQILEGLVAVHESRVLHLDMKPSNIMLSKHASGRWHATLVDFGSARILKGDDDGKDKRGIKGSIHFMSPEQINGETLDLRSDIYSLGCVFYQCLVGVRPFEGDNAIQVMAAHIQNNFQPVQEANPDVPESLAILVNRMLAYEKENRPANCIEIMDAFEQSFQN